MKISRLTILGIILWIPIWIFAYTPLAYQMETHPNNTNYTIESILIFLEVAGIIIMFIGIIHTQNKHYPPWPAQNKKTN